MVGFWLDFAVNQTARFPVKENRAVAVYTNILIFFEGLCIKAGHAELVSAPHK
jgi:hypothetical protein